MKAGQPQPGSRRPYLLRAMHAWMVDNGLTPHIVVNAQTAGVQVPRLHVRDGKIVLNISDGATSGLSLGNETVEFSARFGGIVERVQVPVAAVLGIYARESGQGMIFTDSEEPDPAPSGGSGKQQRAHLKVVK